MINHFTNPARLWCAVIAACALPLRAHAKTLLFATAFSLISTAANAAPTIYLKGLANPNGATGAHVIQEPNGPPPGNANPNSFGVAVDTVTIAGSADYNAVRMLAAVTTTNLAKFERDAGDSHGRVTDYLTINAPGMAGKNGRIIIDYLVSGSVSFSGTTDPEIESSTEYKYDFYASSTSQPNAQVKGYYKVFVDGRIPSDARDILNQKQRISPVFRFGDKVPIHSSLTAFATASERRSNALRTEVKATFQIIEIQDDKGNKLRNFTIDSESGTPYGPQTLWAAGRDLARNEVPDREGERVAVNETVPQWSYGYRATAAGPELTLFAPEHHVNSFGESDAVQGWSDAETHLKVNTGTEPVTFDFGFGPLEPLLPAQIYTHPGAARFAVARWTAPAAGRYNVVGRWLDLDLNGGDGVSCHMVVNGAERFAVEIGNGGSVDLPLTPLDLEAGDVLDFVVGARGNNLFDSTGFNAAISLAPAVELAAAGADEHGRLRSELGQPLVFDATVNFENPAVSVELRENGKTVARRETAPYQFTVENIESGMHVFTAVAVDPRGVEGVSKPIEVTVVQSGPAAARQADSSSATDKATGGMPKAATSSGYTYFFNATSGNWSDPNNWFRLPDFNIGVPGPNDDAFVTFFEEGVGGAVVTLDSKVEVKTLTVGSENKIVAAAGIPSFEIGIRALRAVYLSDAELEGWELSIGQGAEMTMKFDNRLIRMTIINNGQTTFTGPGKTLGDAVTELHNSGTINLQRPPASNKGVELAVPSVQHNGGLIAIQPGGSLLASNLLANGELKLGGIISRDGAGIISRDGAGIISRDGAGLITDNGAGLIGADGASLIGPDGGSLIGTDGASIISRDGAWLREPAAKSQERSQAQATSGGIVLGPGAVVSGRGNLIGNVVNRAGFLAPGSSANIIQIVGDYTQEQNGTLLLEVGGTGANPPQFDQLEIRGTANLGGNLIVKTIDGFTPQAGDTFSPLTYGSVNGSFANISSNAQVNLGADGMTIQVSGANPPAPKALNISTRMRVETGDNVLIAGFIVTGSSPKKVLLRGIGPSLPVSGALADPTLDLDAGAFFNDDWKTTQEQAIRDTTIPPTSDLESAIVATLQPGAHTAVLRGKNDGTGVGLVEVYDLETGSPVQLANISTRGQVQTGDNVMIGGFIIGGNYPAKVLLRAIGPSLPVEGALQDPTLELVDANGATISNDNWRATQEAEIIATTVPPSNDKEAAILATLVPGAYTAIVRGKDDTIGVALVEGYNLQ